MLAIHNDFLSILVPGLQQAVKQKLNGFERFAVAPNQATAFLGINLQRRVATLIPGLLDLHHETEIT